MFRLIICLLTSLLLAASVSAQATTYTDQSAFFSALPGTAAFSGTNFDSLPAGSMIADGQTVDGITFNYLFDGGVQMIVSNVYTTTSAPNFLGTDDLYLFQDGDNFLLEFAPQNAIGMSFITADTMADGDILLTFAGTTVSLVAADIQQTLLDGSKVYFLGIINTDNTFSSSLISTVAGRFFLYNVDDIVLAYTGPIAQVLGIYANGSDWDALFRDRVDGVEDGTTFGYELTGRTNQSETLPWINIDQLMVEFDQLVDPESLDLTDFSFGGSVPGFNGDFSFGDIPTIDAVTPGVGNTVVLTLSHALEPANINLKINASSFTFSGHFGADSSYGFNVLPGNTVDSSPVVNVDDVVDVIGRQNSLIYTGGIFLNYSFRSDVDGNSVINADDVVDTLDRNNSLLVSSRPLPKYSPNGPFEAINGLDNVGASRKNGSFICRPHF